MTFAASWTNRLSHDSCFEAVSWDVNAMITSARVRYEWSQCVYSSLCFSQGLSLLSVSIQSVAVETRLNLHGADSDVRIAGQRGDSSSRWYNKKCHPSHLTIHTTSKKENAQLKQSHLKRSLNWTDENGKCRMLTELFLKLVFSSNPIGWNFTKRIHWLIKPKGRRAGYAMNWRWKIELFRKIVYEEFAVQKLRELDTWELMKFLLKSKKVNSQWISLWFKVRNYRTR